MAYPSPLFLTWIWSPALGSVKILLLLGLHVLDLNMFGLLPVILDLIYYTPSLHLRPFSEAFAVLHSHSCTPLVLTRSPFALPLTVPRYCSREAGALLKRDVLKGIQTRLTGLDLCCRGPRLARLLCFTL